MRRSQVACIRDGRRWPPASVHKKVAGEDRILCNRNGANPRRVFSNDFWKRVTCLACLKAGDRRSVPSAIKAKFDL